MKSLIYGYGVTGKSIEQYLIRKSIDYKIFDDNKDLYSSEHFINKLEDDWEIIYCSPGIDQTTFKKLKNLAKKDVLTDIDIFFKEDNSIKIGITGTNKKSTTCFHLYQILSKENSVNLVGNIGNPVLNSINNGAEYSVIELSSQQLDKIQEMALDFGVLLNLAPDHLDYHGSFEAYKEAKEKVLQSNKTSIENDPFDLYKWITGKDIDRFELKDLPFRLQFISDSIINDSKSTNMHSLKHAIDKTNTFFKDSEYSLIMCGDPKKESFTHFKPIGPSKVFIFGAHRIEIDECIDHPNISIHDDMRSALEEISKNNQSKNILFSPGYPSGDDFKNFEERGECFNNLISEMNL